MATTIKIKSSSVPSKVPDSASLQPAELAINLKDQKLYSKDADGVVFEVGKDADIDLGYTPAADKGTVTNTAGDDAELPLADSSNAGLLAPGDKDKLDEITIGGGGGLEIAGYVKTDDGGTKQSITGGGGLDLAGGLIVEDTVRVNTDATSGRAGLTVNGDVSMNAGNYALRFYSSNDSLGNGDGYTNISRSGGSLQFKTTGGWGKKFLLGLDEDFIAISNDNATGRPDPIADGTAVVHVFNGLNTQFGTNTAQLGNVAPLNDWSCYPARGTTTYTKPTPPAPQPEPVDPGFGVEPTFSGGFTSAGIVSGSIVSTQDIIDLEGE